MEPILQPLDKRKNPDYVDLMFDVPTERKKAYSKITELEQEHHHSKLQPYCRRCARLEFEEQQEKIWDKKGRREGFIMPELQPMPDFDFSSYGDPKRFSMIRETVNKENVKIGGVSIATRTGLYRNYECKERKCKIAIFHPDDNGDRNIQQVVSDEEKRQRGRPKKDDTF